MGEIVKLLKRLDLWKLEIGQILPEMKFEENIIPESIVAGQRKNMILMDGGKPKTESQTTIEIINLCGMDRVVIHSPLNKAKSVDVYYS